MESDGLRSRPTRVPLDASSDYQLDEKHALDEHPGGQIKYGVFMQGVRLVLLVCWWTLCTATIHITQFLGWPLILINRDYYYAYMALTKQQYGIFLSTLTAWFSPTPVWVSGDSSVQGQLKQSSNGALITDFPERLVLIANHQLYTDWLYMWWIAYTGRMHGHIFIVLKESLKYVPVIGPGMIFFGFIFMSRKWAKDQDRMRHRLQRLTVKHKGPMSGSQELDPMWFLIFPEGTNVSANTRKGSVKWAEKQGIDDMRWQVLPRSTGLRFVLSELKDTVGWVYDCTVGYEGIPARGGYGQDFFGLRSTYIQGRPPKSVNMYWRRFPVSSIPINDPKAFEHWVLQRWREKDDLLEYYAQHGRFPPSDRDPNAILEAPGGSAAKKGAGYIVTEVKLAHWLDVGKIFVVVAAAALVWNVISKLWGFVSGAF